MKASITGTPSSSNRGPNRLVMRLPSRLRLPRRRKWRKKSNTWLGRARTPTDCCNPNMSREEVMGDMITVASRLRIRAISISPPSRAT